MNQDSIILALSFVSGLLAALNAFQFVFWGLQVQKLVDKVMSKDYHSYELSRKPFTPPKPLEGEIVVDEDIRPLNDFGA